MDSALAWVGQIAEWLGRFVPRREILDLTSGAIKYRGGNKPVVCGPGIHWWWPWRSTWVFYPTARQADRLQGRAIGTADGRVILVSGMRVYSVADILALVTTTHSPQTTIKDIALTAVHDVCCDLDWDQLKAEQRRGTLDTKLRNAAQKQLTDYGVKVIKLMLIDLSPCRVLKLSQTQSQEEN